jgi:hypothetical protein
MKRDHEDIYAERSTLPMSKTTIMATVQNPEVISNEFSEKSVQIKNM